MAVTPDEELEDLLEYGYGGEQPSAEDIARWKRKEQEDAEDDDDDTLLDVDRPPEVVAHFDVCLCQDVLWLEYEMSISDECNCNPIPPRIPITYHYKTDDYHLESPVHISDKLSKVYLSSRLNEMPDVEIEGRHITISNWHVNVQLAIRIPLEDWHGRARRLWK